MIIKINSLFIRYSCQHSQNKFNKKFNNFSNKINIIRSTTNLKNFLISVYN